MSWCKVEDVNKCLESVRGKGFDDTDIQPRIDRAERFLKNKLLAAYGVSTVTGFDADMPPALVDVCANLSALLMKSDFIDDYKPSTTEKETVFTFLKDLITGKSELLDSSGNQIARGADRVKFSRGAKTPIFTMGNVGDDTYGEGTLDDFGPNQAGIEENL